MSDAFSSSFMLTLFQCRVHWSAALLKHCAVSYTASVHYFNALASTHRIDINRITLPSISTTNNPADGLDPAILPDPRILILSVSPDLSTSSIPIMNCIFSAQKLVSRHSYSSLPFISLDMSIESNDRCLPSLRSRNCVPSTSSTSYRWLVYSSRTSRCTPPIPNRECLLTLPLRTPYFTNPHKMSFLPPPSIRKILAVPTQDKIDFRAACFCHKNIIDIGFVCSVCLSSKVFHLYSNINSQFL